MALILEIKRLHYGYLEAKAQEAADKDQGYQYKPEDVRATTYDYLRATVYTDDLGYKGVVDIVEVDLMTTAYEEALQVLKDHTQYMYDVDVSNVEVQYCYGGNHAR